MPASRPFSFVRMGASPCRPSGAGRAECLVVPLVTAFLFVLSAGTSVVPGAAHASFPAFLEPNGDSEAGEVARSASAPRRDASGAIGSGGGGSGIQLASGPRSVTALRLDRGRGIHLDGRLDDPAWTEAESGGGFRSWDPVRGGPPHGSTVFKVAYDEDAIYLGVSCGEPDPLQATRRLVRRDGFFQSDNVQVYLDPYSDHTTGYYFAVNRLGVQGDGAVFNDGDEDPDWDGVWQAETYEDADGWYAEMRIPLSSIRYRPDATSWGIDVFRETRALGQTDGWTVWGRDESGIVSRLGHLDGLHGLSARRQLELLPYAVYRATDPSVTGPEKLDLYRNLGLDLKYGVTADLAANITLQPDFGQVEADPASLNLTPYETVYQEKRPFFNEGARFLSSPTFTVFYTRRIGTGTDNARIRAAGKLAGKTKSGVSVGLLAAATDVTGEGQAHNFVKTGQLPANFFVTRLGKELGEGRYYANIMQTAVARPGGRDQYGDRGSREAYATEADFGLFSRDRGYSVNGVFVGSVIAPERPIPAAAAVRQYGTGGCLTARKLAGDWRFTADGRWATDRLDLNDAGYLRSPDFAQANFNLMRQYRPTNEDRHLNSLQVNANLVGGWTYAGRTGLDIHTGERAWSYGPGHRAVSSAGLNYFAQLHNFWSTWAGFSRQFESIQRYDTRTTYVTADGRRAAIAGGGPLIGEPATWTMWIGAESDGRRALASSLESTYGVDWAHNIYSSTSVGASWAQSSALHHDLHFNYEFRTDDTQHLENYENTVGGGIGGISYVYGKLRQQTGDLTLRSSILFDRNQSLELYAQPYFTIGKLHAPRELRKAGTYELVPYAAPGFDVRDRDFRYASVNVNAVYRWEYRAGSTLYLVWTHRREAYEERWMASDPSSFRPALAPGVLFDNEPENTFLVKASWYLPV